MCLVICSNLYTPHWIDIGHRLRLVRLEIKRTQLIHLLPEPLPVFCDEQYDSTKAARVGTASNKMVKKASRPVNEIEYLGSMIANGRLGTRPSL